VNLNRTGWQLRTRSSRDRVVGTDTQILVGSGAGSGAGRRDWVVGTDAEILVGSGVGSGMESGVESEAGREVFNND